ncbi:hypothetical protein M9Y10_023415 [Tritrichomonas musculus]|uniref:Protein kinase domain-containing protein n=1 Tax=Tritrichomonas musculus TaxID=1915356 RepID=A0ABR2KV93_9EUKA
MTSTEQLINETQEAARRIFPLAQASYVYRASLAYILQNIKSFINAIQPLKTKELTPPEKQALQRLNGLFSHFETVLPLLGAKWINAALNWHSMHMHNYIDGFRKTLIDICTQLSLDPEKVIIFDKIQDQVNKRADLDHLRNALCSVRESAISCTNSVDVQQLIEARLHSISNHLPSKKEMKQGSKLKAHPSSDAIPIVELKKRMDKELAVFTSIDIPCEDLKLDKALGSGGFGTVFLSIRLSTAELLAVKEVRSDKLTIQTWAALYSEVATMEPLKHRYVLELVGAHIKEPYRIITRFCPGKSLFDRLHRPNMKPLSAERLTAIAYQVAEGMRFLHTNGIVHRDLKTMNILLDDTDTAKIADFGLAGMMKDKKELIGGVGTPHYTAPEVLERKRYGLKVDTYSYGVILWEMATRQIPFRDKTHQEIFDKVVNKQWRLPVNHIQPDSLKRLITRCWAQSPNDRPEFNEIVKLWKDGEIYFDGCKDVSKNFIDEPIACPPLDVDYLKQVLKNPDEKNFPTVVSFLVDHIDEKYRKILQDEKIIDEYKDPKQKNADSIILLASEVLSESDFPTFLDRIGLKMIDFIIDSYNNQLKDNNNEVSINTTNSDDEEDDKSEKDKEKISNPNAIKKKNSISSIVAVVKFCLKVPMEQIDLIMKFIPIFVDMISELALGPYVVRMVARLDSEHVSQFKDKLIKFFTPEGINMINNQNELDALSILLPQIEDSMPSEQIKSFISVLEKNLDVPDNIIDILIQRVPKKSIVRLVLAIVKAGSRSNVSDSLVKVVQLCTQKDIKKLAKHLEIFDELKSLLDGNRLVTASLFLIFMLSMVPSVSSMLANYPLLQSILQIEGHVSQRLQIFTSLFSSEQFCKDTTISEGVLKLLVSSMNDKSPVLANYALKFIGALTSHPSGCELISETGMLSLFAQMFLSSTCGDMTTSLTILSNAAKGKAEIPQISLIVSCLMQDLLYSVSMKSELLRTLIHLIELAPNSVQEHDIQNSVLPLLSSRQESAVVVQVLHLLNACDVNSFRSFYHIIVQKIFNIFMNQDMLYPEIIDESAQLIALLSTKYDIAHFLSQTKIADFLVNAANQMDGKFESIGSRVRDASTVLSTHETSGIDAASDAYNTMKSKIIEAEKQNNANSSDNSKSNNSEDSDSNEEEENNNSSDDKANNDDDDDDSDDSDQDSEEQTVPMSPLAHH